MNGDRCKVETLENKNGETRPRSTSIQPLPTSNINYVRFSGRNNRNARKFWSCAGVHGAETAWSCSSSTTYRRSKAWRLHSLAAASRKNSWKPLSKIRPGQGRPVANPYTGTRVPSERSYSHCHGVGCNCKHLGRGHFNSSPVGGKQPRQLLSITTCKCYPGLQYRDSNKEWFDSLQWFLFVFRWSSPRRCQWCPQCLPKCKQTAQVWIRLLFRVLWNIIAVGICRCETSLEWKNHKIKKRCRSKSCWLLYCALNTTTFQETPCREKNERTIISYQPSIWQP